nr:1299_t:CDS:2 [Entrophospora candida]
MKVGLRLPHERLLYHPMSRLLSEVVGLIEKPNGEITNKYLLLTSHVHLNNARVVERSLSSFKDLGGGVLAPFGCGSGPLFASCPVETELTVSDSRLSKDHFLGVTSDIIKLGEGNHTTSYVAFTENERLIVKADIKHWPFTDIAEYNLEKSKESCYHGSCIFQCLTTRDAGRIAALDILRIINEPTAMAIAYGLDSKDTSGKNILIFDFGGRIFDISLSNMFGYIFAVKATTSDTHSDSEDFDNNLLEYFKQEFKHINTKGKAGDKWHINIF